MMVKLWISLILDDVVQQKVVYVSKQHIGIACNNLLDIILWNVLRLIYSIIWQHATEWYPMWCEAYEVHKQYVVTLQHSALFVWRIFPLKIGKISNVCDVTMSVTFQGKNVSKFVAE